MRGGVLLACVLAVAGAPAIAFGQPADVAAHIKIIETQPPDMDKAMWKEKRRDAARKLAQSKDKRAVPTLIKLAETETFDIIGEIAIEGLGNLGDPSAAPVLQKISADPNRDKIQRELARKAFAKLPAAGTTSGTGGTDVSGGTGGTGATGGTGTTGGTDITGGTGTTGGTVTTTGGTDLTGGTSAGGGLIGERPSSELPPLPVLPDDTLAAYERLTIAAGSAHLGYDTVRKRVAFDADVGALYAKRIERESMAWGWTADANVVAGLINPDGRAQTRGMQIRGTGTGEARFYRGKIYGVGKGAAGLQINYLSDVDADPMAGDIKDTRYIADLQIALGGGYGRLLDVGGAIRVRRLSRALDSARALGKPIDAAVARKLELTWWALRGERSAYRALVATVAILREAGILLGEPDAGLTYEILNVLRDSQLFLRPSGLDIQVTVSEGYLVRPDIDEPGGMPQPNDEAGQKGRVEQLIVSAGYGAQLADDKLELSGNAFARLRLFAPDGTDPDTPRQPSPWAIGASARMKRFTYGDHGDPLGVFDLGGTILLSDDDLIPEGTMGTEKNDLALRIEGTLGFTFWLNQASGFRLAAMTAADGGELFIGGQLEATYGFLDGTFAGL